MTKLTKITKEEEAAFFGQSTEPVFDGGETDYINAAKAFLGTEEAGLEEVQELDDLGFFEVLDTLNTPWGFLDYLD